MIAVFFSLLALSAAGSTSTSSCEPAFTMQRIVAARTTAALNNIGSRGHLSYAEMVLLRARKFDLGPSDANAKGLLRILPTTSADQTTWLGLSDAHCAGESMEALMGIGRFVERLPATVARAAIASPTEMDDFLQFIQWQSGVPDSDADVYAAQVCREKPAAYRASFKRLSADVQSSFCRTRKVLHVRVRNCARLVAERLLLRTSAFEPLRTLTGLIRTVVGG